MADPTTVEGDPRLLRVAIDNLLRNSWKETSSRSSARIEFGVQTFKDGVPVYFVRVDAITESDLIRVPPIACSSGFSGFTARRSFPATVSDSHRCRELYESTVAMRGPKVKLEKAQRFISR
jgi:acyl-CoA thioesterase